MKKTKKTSSLPKPFDPICDYEESEEEEESESEPDEVASESANVNSSKQFAPPPFPPLKSKVVPTDDSEGKDKDIKSNKEAPSSSSSSNSCANAVPIPKTTNEIHEKLRQLEMMKNAARKLNHEAVVEEDRMKKRPANWQALEKKNEWLLYEEEHKQACLKEGKDWDRVKLLSVQADEADKLLSRKRRKNPDVGFASFEQASYRQYDRLTRQMQVDHSEYESHKEEIGEEAQSVNSMYHGTHKPSESAVERMVGDLEKQIAKRAKFSRRRTFIEDKDVDYINERNAKFNKKIERFYGEYTTEIKQNLERGTAI